MAEKHDSEMITKADYELLVDRVAIAKMMGRTFTPATQARPFQHRAGTPNPSPDPGRRSERFRHHPSPLALQHAESCAASCPLP